jgi:pimeloyl-ACP methyl ester carboxylesterase
MLARRTTLAVLTILASLPLALPAAAGDWGEGDVTTSDGVSIHYYEAQPASGEAADGEAAAPALLFVPGWTMSAQIWEPQIDHFAKRRRVVAIDPRSQGLSGRPDDGHTPERRGADVGDVIAALDLAPVVPVCWSLAVAECVAMIEANGTGALAGLVIVDGLAGGPWDPAFSPRMVAWLGNLQRDREAGTAAFVRTMYLEEQSEEYLAKVTAWSLQTPTDAMVALMVGGITNDNRDVLDSLDVPVLMTVSASPFVPRYEEMRDRIPDVRFEVFKAGHALFVDDAEGFNARLDAFLAEIAGGERAAGEAEEAAQ